MLIRHSGAFSGTDDDLVGEYSPADVTRVIDLVYDASSTDGRLDVLYPTGVTEALPVVVWVHGGGFVAGTKDAMPDYLAVIASHGYTVANVEYTKAPEATYPTPVRQLDDALTYLVAHADELHIDPERIVLAGDSAGAHIAAQAALAISDLDYAREAGLPASLDAESLRGVVLCSGAFDPRLADTSDATWGFFLRTVLWAYSGEKDVTRSDAFQWAALPAYVSETFPATFITAGPEDPLLAHSEEMSQALIDAGADVDTLFLEAGSTSQPLEHEYQMDLRIPEAREAMERIVALLRSTTSTPMPLEGVSDRW